MTFLIILHTRCISIVSSLHFKHFSYLLLLLLHRSRHCKVQKDACITYLFYFWRDSPQWAMASSFMRFLDHTQRRTTVGRTPLGERSACRRDLYLTTHNTHNRQTSMTPVGFEPTTSAGERTQTYALERHTSRNTAEK